MHKRSITYAAVNSNKIVYLCLRQFLSIKAESLNFGLDTVLAAGSEGVA